jgi:hypothetical protein
MLNINVEIRNCAVLVQMRPQSAKIQDNSPELVGLLEVVRFWWS